MAENEIKIVLIDETETSSNAKLVLFQRNALEKSPRGPIAWKVSPNPPDDGRTTFVYSEEIEVGVLGPDGDEVAPQPAKYGERWEVIEGATGVDLRRREEPVDAGRVEIANTLPKGEVTAQIHRRGSLLHEQPELLPHQVAAFSFEPRVFVSRVSQAEEGEILESAVYQAEPMELDLGGVAEVEVVMTGGGSGAEARSISFEVRETKER